MKKYFLTLFIPISIFAQSNIKSKTSVFISNPKSKKKVVKQKENNNLPSYPIATFNGEYCIPNSVLTFRINQIEHAELGIFVKQVPDVKGKIKQFSIKVKGYPEFIVHSNIITKEAFEFLKKVKRNEIIIISNMIHFYEGIDGSFKPLPNFAFTITE